MLKFANTSKQHNDFLIIKKNWIFQPHCGPCITNLTDSFIPTLLYKTVIRQGGLGGDRHLSVTAARQPRLPPPPETAPFPSWHLPDPRGGVGGGEQVTAPRVLYSYPISSLQSVTGHNVSPFCRFLIARKFLDFFQIRPFRPAMSSLTSFWHGFFFAV